MSDPRRICIVTGARAEYGHMQWLARDIADDPRLHLQIVATGMHVEERFGMTCEEIEQDGFNVDARVKILEEGDTRDAIARAVGRGVIGLADAFAALQPDILVILGDRYEMLAAASAALILGIPIAHLHGGELTEGAFDDSIRHAITKMAALHFAAAEPYAHRIAQMGEDSARIFCVGAPGLDALDRVPPMDRAALAASIGIALDGNRPILLTTYHPETLSERSPREAVGALLRALRHFPDAAVVLTGVNSDPGNAAIREAANAFVAEAPERAVAVNSLGHRRYLSLMRVAGAVVGNSSSGIIEAPSVGVPTVNIGSRQKGRLRAPSVIDCGETEDAIAEAIARALSSDFRIGSTGHTAPYGGTGASKRIAEILAMIEIAGLRAKSFHDRVAA